MRQARQEAGLTLEQAGAIAGVSKQGISQIERGVTKNPQAATLEPLCRRMGVSLRWLMTGQGPAKTLFPSQGENNSHPSLTESVSTPDPDAAILHEAVTLLLFDLDHGGPRSARSASNLLLDLYRRLKASGGRLPREEEEEFEQQARSRGQQGEHQQHGSAATPRARGKRA